jgi:hypothetical protein
VRVLYIEYIERLSENQAPPGRDARLGGGLLVPVEDAQRAQRVPPAGPIVARLGLWP